ncbi:MAG TPA: hypothetical protein VF678_03840, partial [bacterium]
LDKAEGILHTLLTLLSEPGAAPAGSSLSSDPADAKSVSNDVVVIHGPDGALLQKVTPAIAAAECNRIAIAGWPEDLDAVSRQLEKHRGLLMALVLLADADLYPPKEGTTKPPELTPDVVKALELSVATYGMDKVRVLVQSENPMKPEQLPAKLLRIDARGQWRAALTKLLKSTPS